jgi:hypothetical protein
MAPVAAQMSAQGIKLISPSLVVAAMERLACDESVNGRCLGVGPSGAFDFADDFEGNDGFLALRAFVESGALGEERVREMRAAGRGSRL